MAGRRRCGVVRRRAWRQVEREKGAGVARDLAEMVRSAWSHGGEGRAGVDNCACARSVMAQELPGNFNLERSLARETAGLPRM